MLSEALEGLAGPSWGLLGGLASAVVLMGVAGVPHCAAMCAAPCAVALPQGVGWRALLARSVGYAALGAVAAGMTTWLGRWSAVAAMLQPLWLMALFASVLFGAWLLWRGEMPMQVQAQGQMAYRWLQDRVGGRFRGPAAARWGWVLAVFWAALPCGLLYGAVGVAALAPHAWQGAVLMAMFSLPGAVAIVLAPRALARVARTAVVTPVQAPVGVAPVLWHPKPSDGAGLKAASTTSPALNLGRWKGWSDARLALRLAGLSLLLGCGWALSQRLWSQWQAWCA